MRNKETEVQGGEMCGKWGGMAGSILQCPGRVYSLALAWHPMNILKISLYHDLYIELVIPPQAVLVDVFMLRISRVFYSY